MESDVQEPTLSPSEHLLNRYLPLPYRVATLIVLGKPSPTPTTIGKNPYQTPTRKTATKTNTIPCSITAFYLYALNLRLLAAHAIDVPSLLRYHPSPHAHASVARLALFLALPLAISIACYALLPYAFFPTTYLLYIPLALALPVSHLSRRGRARFWSTLRRVSVGGLATDNEGRFADILMADVLTSYAKPVADLWVVGCSVVSGEGVQGKVDRSCGGSFMVPGLIAVPFL